MNFPRLSIRSFGLFGLLVLTGAGTARAQIDRIYPDSGSAVVGTIESVDKNGITVKTGGNSQHIAAGNIDKVMFQGDPAGLTKGREFAIDGQYQQALEELKTVDADELPREAIRADARYYRVLSEAKLALAGQGELQQAAQATLEFARKHPQTWHFFDAAKLLGDLALRLENYDQALKYYRYLANAPAAETKIASVYHTGMTRLQQGQFDQAKAAFEKVNQAQSQSPKAVRLQTLAKAGQAVALARQGEPAEALELVQTLIAELDPTDIETAAQIYNAQGASYLASGDQEGAIMAYLHTHLMFSGEPSAHAEALSQLVELWPKVGKPDRAAEMRQELRQRYPGYGS